MPPRSTAERGYASYDEYSNVRTQLKQLVDANVIDITQYRQLLESNKSDVDSFMENALLKLPKSKAQIIPPIAYPNVEIEPVDVTIKKDADILRTKGLISEQDYLEATSGDIQKRVDALSRAFGSNEQARSTLTKLPDDEIFKNVVETPSGLRFGFVQPTYKPKPLGVDVEIPEVKITQAAEQAFPTAPKTLPPAYVPPADVQAAAGEAAKREAERRGLTADIGTVVDEMRSKTSAITKVPRSPSGQPRPYPIATAGRLGVEEQPSSILEAIKPQEIMFKSDKDALDEGGILGQTLSKLIAREKDGRIVESYPAYIGRMLGVIPETAIGLAEGITTGKTTSEAIAKRIQQGRGFSGLGYDLGDSLEKAIFGSNKELYDKSRGLISTRLAMLGFGVDLLVPLDLGISDVMKGVSAIRKLRGAADKIGSEAPELAKAIRKVADPKAPLIKDIYKMFSDVEPSFTDPAGYIKRNALFTFVSDPNNISSGTVAFRSSNGLTPRTPAYNAAVHSAESLGLGKVEYLAGEGKRIFVPDTNIWSAAYADALAKAKTHEEKYLLSRLFLEQMQEKADRSVTTVAMQSIREALEDMPKVSTEEQFLKYRESNVNRLDDAYQNTDKLNEASNKLTASALRYSGMKQLSLVSKALSSATNTVRIGDVLLPTSEIDNVRAKVKDIIGTDIKPTDFLKTGKVELKGIDRVTFISRLDPYIRTISDPVSKQALGFLERGDDARKPLVITREDWNNLVTTVTEEVAKRDPTAKLVEGLTAEPILEITELGDIISAGLPKKLEDLTPRQKDILEEAKSNLSSIPDTLRKRVADNMREMKNVPIKNRKSQAFAKAIFDGFTERYGYKKVGDTFVDAFSKAETKDKFDFYEDLFKDYLATIYGGEEKVVDTARLLTGTEMAGLDPIQTRRSINALLRLDTIYSTALSEFQKAAGKGDYAGALDVLGRLHKLVEGKTIREVYPYIERTARKKMPAVVWEYPTREGAVRGMRDLYDFADKAKPVIPSNQFMSAITSIYSNRKARDIIDRTADKVTPKLTKELRNLGRNLFNETIESMKPLMYKMGLRGKQISEAISLARKNDNTKNILQHIVGAREKDILANEKLKSAVDHMFKNILQDLDESRFEPAFEFDVLSHLIEQHKRDVFYPRLNKLADKVYDLVQYDSKLPEFTKVYGPLLPEELLETVLYTIKSGLEAPRVSQSKEFKKALTDSPVGRVIYNELQSSRNLAQLSRTMNNIKQLPKTNIAPDLADKLATSDLKELVRVLNDKSLSPKFSERALRFGKSILDNPIEALKSAATGVETLVKSGMLAGAYVPNFAYHATNIMTAPFLMLSTIGPKKALAATADFFDPTVNNAMNDLFGVPTAANIKQATGFTTPDGKVYTSDALAEIVAKNNISQTKDALALSKNMISDFVKWSGRNLSGEEVGIARRFARELDPTKPNVWYEVANYFDTRFRTAVLKGALAQGKTEQEAIKLARESLFDYSKLSDFEKDFISKIVWFWSFERSAIAQVGKNLLNNPRRFFLEQKAKGLFRDDDDTLHSATSDYSENRPFLDLVESTKEDYNLYGPPLPQADTLAKLADYIGAGYPIITGDIPGTVRGIGKKALDRVAAAISVSGPLAALGYEINRGEISEPTNYIDPRMMNWIKLNPWMEKLFTSMVNLEPIPPEELKPSMQTFDGLAYRIPFNDKKSKYNYNALLEAAKTIGVERAMRDYAQWFGETEGEQVPSTVDIPLNNIEFLRNLGIIKVEPVKTGDQVRSGVRRQTISEMGEL